MRSVVQHLDALIGGPLAAPDHRVNAGEADWAYLVDVSGTAWRSVQPLTRGSAQAELAIARTASRWRDEMPRRPPRVSRASELSWMQSIS